MTSTLRVPVRYLQAADDDDFNEDDPPWRFSGIAVAPGDVLHMEDGTPVLFKQEPLRNGANSQAGEPLTADHPQNDLGRPEYPPSTDDTYGKVPKADYIEGKGVAYEATTHDPELARGIYAGTYEVSIHPRFKAETTDDETGLLMAEDIEFLDLSVVSKGDSPSNTANWGPSQELAAWVHNTDIAAELAGTDESPGAGPDEPDPSPRGFLQTVADVLGVNVDLDSDAGTETVTVDEQDGDEPAESGATDSDKMDNKIQTLVSEHDFNEESLEAMSDADLERLYESVAEADSDDGDGGSDGTQDSATNTVEVDIGDHDSFEDFVSDVASEEVEAAKTQTEKADLVDEIIAHSENFDEDDRDELMSSAKPVVEKLHGEATEVTAARLPGATGREQVAAGAGGNGNSEQYQEIVGQLNDSDTGGD